MSNFTEKPILLVNEKFELNQEGVDFIKSLSDKKISIISIIGPKSSGKSFLSNQLIGKFRDAFEIGSINTQNECCTKGIWIWGKPIINNDLYTLIFDAQGFQKESQEQIEFSQKIFVLLNLISTTVIYNYRKDDESDDNNNISEQVVKNSYELFSQLLPILDRVKLDKNGNRITSENIPNYFWLYRDYTIKDFKQYIDIINSASSGNGIYSSLIKTKIKYFSLPPPMEENEMLINLYLDEDDDGKGGPFTDEYKLKLEEFKKLLFEGGSPKMLDTFCMNGALLEQLINDYMKSLSQNETIYAYDVLTNLLEEQLIKIKNGIIDSLKNNLNDKNSNINDIISKIKNSYEILSDKAFDSLGEVKVQNKSIIQSINNIIDLYGKELIDTFLNNKITEYDNSLKEIITQRENSSSLLNKISSKEEIKSFFSNFNDEIKKDLENTIFNSKYEFLSCFPSMRNYIEKCILNNIALYMDNINEFFDASIKEQKAAEETMKLLEEKNNEVNTQKSQIEQMTSEIEELKKNSESKEKEYETNLQMKKDEYETNLQTKKEEYEKLEQEKKSMMDEKDNLIKELQDKLNNLEKEKSEILEKNENLQKNLDETTNKNKELEQQVNDFIEKEKRKPKPQMVNVKEEDLPKLVELFNEMQTATKEYTESIKSFAKNKSKIFFHNQFIEETKASTEGNCAKWVEELKKISKEKLESKDNIYNLEINRLKEENNKLNEELNKIKDEANVAKDENKKLNDELILSKEIRNDIETYKKDNENTIKLLKTTNEMQEKRLTENMKKMTELEFSLSNYKVESKMKEDELNLTLNSFRCLLDKNKKNFENSLKKLSEKTIKEIDSINKKYKIIK